MKIWVDYYDSVHSIYVSDVHRDAHFRLIADDLIRFIPRADAVMLDYSCGEALDAARVASACGKLILAEPAPGVRQRLKTTFAANPKIAVVSLDDLDTMAKDSIDCAALISVAQYMDSGDFDRMLGKMFGWLKSGGRLLIGDIVQPDTGAWRDVIALLRLAAHEGFLLDALAGLVRMAFSDYRRLRQQTGLQRYSEADMLARLTTAGFAATRLTANVGHNPARMSFIATKPPVATRP